MRDQVRRILVAPQPGCSAAIKVRTRDNQGEKVS